jgi:undecaprenyl-diphosphatase
MIWPEWDTSLLLAINSHHHPTFDVLMWWVSKPWIWTPLYILIFAVCTKKYGWKNAGYILLAFCALILCTDFLNLHGIKNTVQRLRPTHEPMLSGILHLLSDENGHPYLGGLYGFISSHAANHFGMAFLMAKITRPWLKAAPWLFYLWAFIIAYSRVYMGVHYPLDVICGAAFGIAAGGFIYWAMHRIIKPLETVVGT